MSVQAGSPSPATATAAAVVVTIFHSVFCESSAIPASEMTTYSCGPEVMVGGNWFSGSTATLTITGILFDPLKSAMGETRGVLAAAVLKAIEQAGMLTTGSADVGGSGGLGQKGLSSFDDDRRTSWTGEAALGDQLCLRCVYNSTGRGAF